MSIPTGMICVWPDDTWCWLVDIEEYGYKSDDYALLFAGYCESETDIEAMVVDYNEYK